MARNGPDRTLREAIAPQCGGKPHAHVRDLPAQAGACPCSDAARPQEPLQRLRGPPREREHAAVSPEAGAALVWILTLAALLIRAHREVSR